MLHDANSESETWPCQFRCSRRRTRYDCSVQTRYYTSTLPLFPYPTQRTNVEKPVVKIKKSERNAKKENVKEQGEKKKKRWNEQKK